MPPADGDADGAGTPSLHSAEYGALPTLGTFHARHHRGRRQRGVPRSAVRVSRQHLANGHARPIRCIAVRGPELNPTVESRRSGRPMKSVAGSGPARIRVDGHSRGSSSPIRAA